MATVTQLQQRVAELEAEIADLREEVRDAVKLRTIAGMLAVPWSPVPPPRHLHPVGTS